MSINQSMTKDAEARMCAIDVRRSVLCKAPAGSGKTELLVQRALACLALARNPEEVVLLTFTTKAAHELRERLTGALTHGAGAEPTEAHSKQTWSLARAVLERDRALQWGLALNPSRLRAMTIDALNSFLAGQAPVVSGMGGGVSVEERPTQIYREAILSLFGELDDLDEADPLRAALYAVLRFARNRFEDLVPILSGMLSQRDQWLPMVAEQSGGADEGRFIVSSIITARLQQLASYISPSTRETIAAACHAAGRFDDSSWPDVDEDQLPKWQTLCELLVTKAGTLRKRLQAPDGFPPKAAHTEDMKHLLAELGAHPDAIRLGDVASQIVELPSVHDVEDVREFTDQVKTVLFRLVGHLHLAFVSVGAIDFVEVARRAITALGDEEGSSPLLERMDYRMQHLLVDEVQDTSDAQYRLLTALTRGWEPGDGRTLFMVGDAQQSIYAFRQANVRRFMEIWHAGAFGDIALDCITLTRNFRSDAAIVDWCNTAFRRVFPSIDDYIGGGVCYSPFESARGGQGGSVTCHWFTGEPDREEAREVVSIVQSTRLADPDGSIAILCRNRTHVRDTLEELRRAGISYSCKDIDPLASSPAVRDVVALARAMWHELDRVAWGTLLRAPFVGLSYADMLALTVGNTAGSWLELLRHRGFATLSDDGRRRATRLLEVLESALGDRDLASDLGMFCEAVWNALGGPACVTYAEAQDVRSVFSLLQQHLRGGRLVDLAAFEDGLSKLYASPEAGGEVTVLTQHGSKGLEFDHCVLVGLWRGQRVKDAPFLAHRNTAAGTLMVPGTGPRATEGHHRLFRLVCGLNRDADNLEGLRLLYVACTRARKTMHLIGGTGSSGVPATGSLLRSLWPALESDFLASQPVVGTGRSVDGNLLCPLSERLPATWVYPVPASSYIPPRIRSLQPSELAVRDDMPRTDRAASIFERLVGTAYHETMAFLLDRGEIRRFDQLVSRISVPMRAGLRRRGMPAPRVEEAVTRVIQLVHRTIASPDGDWVVRERADAANEVRLSGYLDGDWVTGALDRVLVDERDQLWVVDYKTGGAGLTGALAEHFMLEEINRYLPQMAAYRRMLGEYRGRPVRAAIFFPEFCRLAEVDDGLKHR